MSENTMSDEGLPIKCPHCGEQFGFGPAIVLLQIGHFEEREINEPAPCCGERVKARFFRQPQGLHDFTVGVEVLDG